MNFFITSPHSGEKIPQGADWLKSLPEPILMADVDRYVDQFYEPVTSVLNILFIKSEWHRYAADLNRVPNDVDCDSVVGHINKSGMHSDGLHWVKTKNGQTIMQEPMSLALHEKIVETCYYPFHNRVKKSYEEFKTNHQTVYQLDAHSMPSLGTKNHRDPGELREEIVISDQDGQSCSSQYFELVCESYLNSGFKVKQNWPYKGGRITQMYGQPDIGQHCIQVELNRSLYMDEATKQKLVGPFEDIKLKIKKAVQAVAKGVDQL